MSEPEPPRPAPALVRAAFASVALAAWLVPSWRRPAFRRQWHADLWAYCRYLERGPAPMLGSRTDLFVRSLGAFRHAIWLRTTEWSLEMLLQDLRYGIRLLIRRPAFTAVAVLILGLGIGANATIFSWVEAMVLRPLPGVPVADRLVVLHGTMRSRNDLSVSYPNFKDLRDQPPPGVEALVCQRFEPMSLRADASAERVWGSLVSANYFDVLQVKPAAGRTFQPSEDVTPGTHPVVVLSHRFWERRFRRDPGIVGRTIMLNERPFTVVGVAAERFQGTVVGVASDLFVPVTMQAAVMGSQRLDQRGNSWLKVMVRLAPGTTIDQAQAGFDLAARRLQEYPDNRGRGLAVYPLWRAPSEASGMMAPVFAVLMAVVGIILLIACANLASLLLVRATSREREMAMRLALGAGRLRLTRQMLTESLLLAALGGVAGLALAYWTADLLTAFMPPTRIPLLVETSLSPRVFAFAALVTIATAVVFGLTPALHSSRTNLVPALKGEGGTSRRGSLLRKGLVVAQVALSLLLLVTAALFFRTLGNARSMDPGFSLRQGLVTSLDLLPAGYDAARCETFYRDLVTRVQALPGVRAAAIAERIPLSLGGSDMLVEIEGYTPAKDEEIDVYYNRIGAGYFDTMGIPILDGRALDERDARGKPGVIVINETMARRYWKAGKAIGGRVRVGPDWLEVVGVAKSGKYGTLTEAPKSYMYLSVYQYYRTSAILHVRADGDPLRLIPAIERQVRAIDPRLPVFDVMTIEEHLQLSVFMQRMAATLLGVFGLLALLLASTGLYGVLAYLTAQRTREIGVRLALGASRGEIVRLVVRQGMAVTLIGIAVGLIAAAAGGSVLASQLIGVAPLDPLSIAVTLAILLTAAFLACYLPARRAAWQDPLQALRHE